MSAERDLETSSVSSPMSSKLAGVLVVGCLVAGIVISGRHRPSAHTDEEEVVGTELLDAPIELPEHSDYFRRPERRRSPASSARSREAAMTEPAANSVDPSAATSATNQPKLENKHFRKSQPNQADRSGVTTAAHIAEPSPEVRLVSGTAPARPKLRIRPTEPVAKAETSDSSPPLRPSRPASAETPREEQPKRLTHHIIRDGDTLESIAELRLGNARRWRELYELNRATLSDPESLPVGVKLRLPQEPPKISPTRQADADGLEPIGSWEN